jgi:hypothetical protein
MLAKALKARSRNSGTAFGSAATKRSSMSSTSWIEVKSETDGLSNSTRPKSKRALAGRQQLVVQLGDEGRQGRAERIAGEVDLGDLDAVLHPVERQPHQPVHVDGVVPEPARHAGGRGVDDEVRMGLVRQGDDVVAGVPKKGGEPPVDVGLPAAAGAGDHENQRRRARLGQEAELGAEPLEEEDRRHLPVGQRLDAKRQRLAPLLDLWQHHPVGRRRGDHGGDQGVDEGEIVSPDALGRSGWRGEHGHDQDGDAEQSGG